MEQTERDALTARLGIFVQGLGEAILREVASAMDAQAQRIVGLDAEVERLNTGWQNANAIVLERGCQVSALSAEVEAVLKDRVCLALRVEELEKQVFALTGEVENKADYAARMYRMHQEARAELALESQDNQAHQQAMDIACEERDAYRAELEALRSQEPVAYLCERESGNFDVLTDQTCKKCFPVFAAPVAPAQPDDSDINQVHAGNAQVSYPTINFAQPERNP